MRGGFCTGSVGGRGVIVRCLLLGGFWCWLRCRAMLLLVDRASVIRPLCMAVSIGLCSGFWLFCGYRYFGCWLFLSV